MAEDTGQEKTHEPTERRKQQFRDKGDIPKSKEVSGTIGLVTAVMVLAIFMQNIAFGIKGVFTLSFSSVSYTHLTLPTKA